MKRLVVLFSFVFASVSIFAASKTATQAWVKNYVASNAAPRVASNAIDPTVVTVYNDNGEAETVIFNWCVSTNTALRVVDSNVESMPVGETFVKVGDKWFYNATNNFCSSITGVVEQIGYQLTGAVNQVVGNVTNRVWLGTNNIYGVVYRANVGGVIYKSFQAAQGLFAFQPDTTNLTTSLFWMREVKVSDITRDRILTPPLSVAESRRFSLFELFFPSAYAISRGEKVGPVAYRTIPDPPIPNQAYEVQGKYQYYYFTDASDEYEYTLGTIEWIDSHGEKATYTIDMTLGNISAGVEISKFKTISESDGLAQESFYAKLKAALPTARYNQMTRGTARDAVLAKADEVYGKYVEYNNYIVEYKKSIKPYPEVGDWEYISTQFNPCKNHIWDGECGSWRCTRCGYVAYEGDGYDMPKYHYYDREGEGLCAKCQNSGANWRCNNRPRDIAWHTGWKNEWIDGCNKCRCQCYQRYSDGRVDGFCLEHEDPYTAIEYVAGTDNQCYRRWKCKRCGEEVKFDGIPSNNPGCTSTMANHSFSCGGVFRQVITNDVNMCSADYTCDHRYDGTELAAKGCGSHIVELMEHDPDEGLKHLVEIPDNDSEHNEIAPCTHGYGTSGWCGYYATNLQAHTYSYWRDPGKVGDKFCPPDETYHYEYWMCADTYGSFDMTNHCGHKKTVPREHSWDLQRYGDPKETDHAVSNMCFICRYMKFVDREDHVESPVFNTYKYLDITNHIVTSVCARAGCEREFFARNEAHEPYYYYKTDSGTPGYYISNDYHDLSNYCSRCRNNIYIKTESHEPYYLYNSKATTPCYLYSEECHDVSNRCTKCHKHIFIGRESHYTNDSPVEIYDPLPEGHHKLKYRCAGFACAGFFVAGIYGCNELGEWKCSDSHVTGRVDRVQCSLCKQFNNVPHRFIPSFDTNKCWCANGGKYHALGPHEFVDNICIYCRYNRTAQEIEPDNVTYEYVYCPSCHFEPTALRCWAKEKYINGVFVEVVESNCGRTINPNCTWGWDAIRRCCGCPMCQAGVSGMCQCGALMIVYGPFFGPTFGSNN